MDTVGCIVVALCGNKKCDEPGEVNEQLQHEKEEYVKWQSKSRSGKNYIFT